MKKFLITASILCSTYSWAQSMERQLVSSAGNMGSLGGISVDWTLGEVVVGNATGASHSATLGFQQAYIKVSSLEQNPSLLIHVFPNPTKNWIQINPQEFNEEYDLTLIDISGKILYASQHTGNTHVSMEQFANGVYILQFQAANIRQTFKIIKSN